jgi:hypothetical protein
MLNHVVLFHKTTPSAFRDRDIILFEATKHMSTMKAIGVSTYGSVEKLESRDVPRPVAPTGRDVLVQ